MKTRCLVFLILYSFIAGCGNRATVNGIYRVYTGKKNGLDIWIVDGSKVRYRLYKEFLYGGNDQRYCFTPPGEIWIDHAVSCEEYELTLAHELNERHLMAKYGWTYYKAHDSSLSVELVMRHAFDSVCRHHEACLQPVAPTDWTGEKEIMALPATITLNGIYRIPVGSEDGLTIWIVDGYLVRKNIFPDFGFSGNDLVYHFIPAKEIWIDGQVSCEEMLYSIAAEKYERRMMQSGKSFSDAYEASVEMTRNLRDRMDGRVRNHVPLVIPDTLDRDAGIRDPEER